MDPGKPLFSVVVPTFGRPEQLSACLQALASLDFPRDRFEVIVADDGCPAETERVVRDFSRLNIQLVKQAHSGPAAARNAGVARARGKYLAFTDDDCAPDRSWLRVLEPILRVSPGAAIGGKTVNSVKHSVYSEASQVLIDYLYSYFNGAPAEARFFTTNNMALAAEKFRAIGGFDASFPLAAAEDREFCERWRENGLDLVYVEDAVVYHGHYLTFRSFCQQHFNYGRGALHLHRVRARNGELRVRLQPFSFYRNLLLHPLANGMSLRGLRLSILLFISQAVYGVGYFRERLRERLRSADGDR